MFVLISVAACANLGRTSLGSSGRRGHDRPSALSKGACGPQFGPAILPARSGCLAGCWSAWPLPLFRSGQVLELGARLCGCCPGGGEAAVMLTAHMRWLQVLPPAFAAEEAALCERYEMVERM